MEADDEPLKVQDVQVPAEVAEQLQDCWEKQHGKSLYKSADEYVDFVKQV